MVYGLLLGLFPTIGSALNHGFLTLYPTQQFLSENYYTSLAEFRSYQLFELRIALYSILFGLGVFLVQREMVYQSVRKKADISKDAATQILLAAVTLPFVVSFLMPFDLFGVILLLIASLYGFYMIYQGFLYFGKTDAETAKLATLTFIAFGLIISLLVRTIISMMYY